MTASFIGCKISLISKSEIRYEGILYSIDTKESTIALAKVRSYGTEDRVTDKPIAARNEVYEYIIFRASDIKDLLVDDPPAASPGLSDPAIVQAQSGASSPSFPSSSGGYGAPGSGSASVAGLIGSVQSPGQQRSSVPVSVSQASKSGGQLSNVLAAGGSSAGIIGGHRSGSRGRDSQGHDDKDEGKQQNRTQRRDGSGNRGDNRPRTFNDRRPLGQDNNQRSGNDRRFGGQNQFQNRRAGQGFRDNNRDGQGYRDNRDGQGFRDNRDGFRGQRDGDRQMSGGFRQRSDWPGSRPSRQNDDRVNNTNRPPRRPQMLDVRKLEEFDFEKANAEFEELTKDVEDLKVEDKKSEGDAQDAKNDGKEETPETYNKTKSFFDTISCEALERQKGNTNRVDRRLERKQNTETFGVAGIYNRNWRGRGGRGGYNNSYNRNYNNNGNRNFSRNNYNNRFNNNSEGEGGERRPFRNNNRERTERVSERVN